MTTTTTGEDLDLSAYVVTVGEVVKRIERDDEVTFASLAAGDHDVRLLDVADNCAINGAVTRQVGVTAGNTTEVSFEVSCTALPPAEVDVTGTWTGTFVEVDPETGEEISPVGPLRYELEQDGDEVTVNRIRYVSVEYTGVGRVSGHTLTLFHIGCDSSSTPGGCFGEGSPADGEDKVTSVLEVTGDRMVGAEREQLDHYAIEMELVRE